MAAITKTITIDPQILLSIFQHDNSKKYFKDNFTGLSHFEFDGPDTRFSSSPSSKPIQHNLNIKKEKNNVEISGTIKLKFAIKPGMEDDFDAAMKKPLLNQVVFTTSEGYVDVGTLVSMQNPTPEKTISNIKIK